MHLFKISFLEIFHLCKRDIFVRSLDILDSVETLGEDLILYADSLLLQPVCDLQLHLFVSFCGLQLVIGGFRLQETQDLVQPLLNDIAVSI